MDDFCHSVWCFVLHLDQLPDDGSALVGSFAELFGRLLAGLI